MIGAMSALYYASYADVYKEHRGNNVEEWMIRYTYSPPYLRGIMPGVFSALPGTSSPEAQYSGLLCLPNYTRKPRRYGLFGLFSTCTVAFQQAITRTQGDRVNLVIGEEDPTA